MKICIPTYNRERLKTIELLRGFFSREEIIISTQCQRDYELIKNKYSGDAIIIFKNGNCVGDNRNTLLEYCQENGFPNCIMLDDDISRFRRMNGYVAGESARQLLLSKQSISEKLGAVLWGTYPNDNRLSFYDKITCNLLTGTCLGINDTSLRFNSKFRIKEDFELCLRAMQQGGKVLRFNDFAPSAAHKTRGGCESDWKNKDIGEYATALVQMYPSLCVLKKGNKEIKLRNLNNGIL